MNATRTRIAAHSPQGLFFLLFPAEAAHVARQIEQVDGLEELTLISSDSLLLAAPEATGVYLTGPELGDGNNVNQATYKKRYGEGSTSAYLAHAYDATTLLLHAIEQVAVAAGGRLYIDRARLRQALTDTTGFQGIIGVISCDRFGDCGTGRAEIRHHTDPAITDFAELPVVYRYSR